MSDAFRQPPNIATAGDGADDPRITALHDLLQRHGLPEVRASAVGNRQEIVALSAPLHLADRLAELATVIKALGFLYVTLDLDTTGVIQDSASTFVHTSNAEPRPQEEGRKMNTEH